MKQKVYVADAGAMIAYLRNEPGGSHFADILKEEGALCCAHGAQFAEVFYDFLRQGGEAAAQTALSTLEGIGIQAREDMDKPFWQDLARIKAGFNPSFADCFGLALTRRVGGALLSTDHHELDRAEMRDLCPVLFVR